MAAHPAATLSESKFKKITIIKAELKKFPPTILARYSWEWEQSHIARSSNTLNACLIGIALFAIIFPESYLNTEATICQRQAPNLASWKKN